MFALHEVLRLPLHECLVDARDDRRRHRCAGLSKVRPGANIVAVRSSAGTSAGCTADSRVSGDAADGIYTCAFTIPVGAATGTWSILTLQATDMLGNYHAVGASEFAERGLATSITVTRQ